MYYTHDLRTNLQEWKNRLYRASYVQFGSQLLSFLRHIEKEPILAGIITEINNKSTIDKGFIEKWVGSSFPSYLFDNDEDQAIFSYLLTKHIIQKHGVNKVLLMNFLGTKRGTEGQSHYIETFIEPFTNYLHDRLDKSNSILYLLEKYKKRVEWFKRQELFDKYKSADKGYEQILEDDLRLFLFDQGIDYPFSTPKSSSGRADLLGLIDTENPLIAEIKIYDSEKNYGKNRIISGFSQIVKYANDYNKDSGYLVIFNLDNVELKFNFSESQERFPPRLIFNNKMYYFIVVNLFYDYTASTLKKTKTVEMTESELYEGTKKEI